VPIPAFLKPFFTTRFLRFATVGASGVVVNLGALALLTAGGLTSTFASALAIQVSILTNFFLNDLWTFRDHDDLGSRLRRALRFQAVSLVGAVVQWSVFVLGNVGALWLTAGSAGLLTWASEAGDGLVAWVRHPIVHPPDVGAWIYPAQLLGIGVAMGWNFLANFKWTWRSR
jgi:putative flippase GtrA